MPVDLKVNGAVHSVAAEPDTPLLYVLRNDLGLNAAKFGCGLGQCGACTVLVDGAPVRSCITPIGALEQSEVVTLEGLGTLERPHPLQAAFMAEQAAQCGYCIAGMIMMAKRFSTATRARARPTCDSDSSAISAVAGPITGSSARFSKRRRRWGEVNEDEPGRSCVPRPSAASLPVALC